MCRNNLQQMFCVAMIAWFMHNGQTRLSAADISTQKLKKTFRDLSDPGNENPDSDRGKADKSGSVYGKNATPPAPHSFRPAGNGWAVMYDDVAGIGGTSSGSPSLVKVRWPEDAVSDTAASFPLRATGNLTTLPGGGGGGGEPPTWKLALKAVTVALVVKHTTNDPDISPRVCTNAQERYEFAPYLAEVRPKGSTATVKVELGPVELFRNNGHVGHKILKGVKDGDTVWVRALSEVGKYRIKITHDMDAGVTDRKNSLVFEFVDPQFGKALNYKFGKTSSGVGATSKQTGINSMGLGYDNWSIYPDTKKGQAAGVLSAGLTINVNPKGAYMGQVQAGIISRGGRSFFALMSTFCAPAISIGGIDIGFGESEASIARRQIIITGSSKPSPWLRTYSDIKIKCPTNMFKPISAILDNPNIPGALKKSLKEYGNKYGVAVIPFDSYTGDKYWNPGGWPPRFKGPVGSNYTIVYSGLIKGKVWGIAWANAGATLKAPTLSIEQLSYNIVR